MKFKTKLWRRGQRSYATTIPNIVLLEIDEQKKYEVIWEFNKRLKKWTISIKKGD